MGKAILKSANFNSIRGIISVPLLSKRKQERSYYKSEIIASQQLKLFKNMYTNYLKGIIDTPSLDLADQSDRLKIIKNVFETQASLKKTKEHFLYINI